MSEHNQNMIIDEQKTAKSATESDPKLRIPSSRKRNLIILTLIFILIAVIFTLMYLLKWRFQENTDDAYVNSHLVQITPQISGTVQSVNADDTQRVKAGQILVTLDNSDAQLAFERAQDELINAIRQNQQQQAQYSQSKAQVIAQKAQLARLQADLKRRESLAGSDAISAEELSHARAAVTEAEAHLQVTQGQEKASKAVLGHNVPLRQQPAILTAISHVKSAWLDLQRTQIKAPLEGQIAKRNVQLGQKVATGSALMAVVPLSQVWVDANFKESQLANIRVGQPVIMTADVYGKKVKYHGKVVGLSAGTGAAFALLPAQNATGNWIKVVQRLPVRIQLDASELAQHPLQVGLSMNVVVDTHDRQGKNLVAIDAVHTDKIADQDWTAVNQLIEQIFNQYE